MGGEVRNVIEEVKIEIIKSSLIKYWRPIKCPC